MSYVTTQPEMLGRGSRRRAQYRLGGERRKRGRGRPDDRRGSRRRR